MYLFSFLFSFSHFFLLVKFCMYMCVMCISTHECTCVCLYVENRGHLWDSSSTAHLRKGSECVYMYISVGCFSHMGIRRDQAYVDIQTFATVTVHLTL